MVFRDNDHGRPFWRQFWIWGRHLHLAARLMRHAVFMEHPSYFSMEISL
jgi:hypothetical protein